MDTFELPRTHVHLGVDGSGELLDGAELWSRPPATLDEALSGWLVASFPVVAEDEPGHREVHPNGDEVLYLPTGALDVLLEDQDGERLVALRSGQACLVASGTWHRLRGREPGTLVTITYGRGTQHG